MGFLCESFKSPEHNKLQPKYFTVMVFEIVFYMDNGENNLQNIFNGFLIILFTLTCSIHQTSGFQFQYYDIFLNFSKQTDHIHTKKLFFITASS